jgi:hypothetical protein
VKDCLHFLKLIIDKLIKLTVLQQIFKLWKTCPLLIMVVTTLYIKYMLSAHWTFCCTGNETFIKVYQWFYWTSNPKFWERSQPIPRGRKAVFYLASFLLEVQYVRVLTYKSEWWTDNLSFNKSLNCERHAPFLDHINYSNKKNIGFGTFL